MSASLFHAVHRPNWPLRIAVAATALLVIAWPRQPVVAEDPASEPVLKVEEDWTLMLIQPQTEVNAPQFHTVLSPFGVLGPVYFQFTWNYRPEGEYEAGGLQAQVWHNDEAAVTRDAGVMLFSSEAETVTWTQTLETNGATLTGRVVNGHSASWGNFGGDDMTVTYNQGVANLNAYSTMVTRAGSWISYGSNRVHVLMITQVRRYGASGLLSVDYTPRVIYHQPS